MNRPSRLAQPMLILAAVGFSLPILWMIAGSLKPPGQPESDFWPRTFHWQNYQEVLTSADYLRFLANSILYRVATVTGTLES